MKKLIFSLLLTIIFSAPAAGESFIFLAGGKYCKTKVSAWEFYQMDMEVLVPPCDQVNEIDLNGLSQPIYVGGISTGSIKAMEFAIKNKDKINGVVLLSAITTVRCSWCGSLLFTDYAKYKGPILFVNHEGDRCPSTNDTWATNNFARKFEDVEMVTVTGGYDNGGPSLPDKCFKNTYHAFSGVETEVTKKIAEWIRKRKKRGLN
jgi:esterase/lipase superfamily enzyme